MTNQQKEEEETIMLPTDEQLNNAINKLENEEQNINQLKELKLSFYEEDKLGNLTKFNKEKAIYNIATHLVNKENFKTIHGAKKEEIYMYSQGVYTNNAEEYIKKNVQEILQEKNNNYIINETIGHITRKTFISSQEFKEGGKEYICLQNGILDINTLTVIPHTPDKIFLNKIPINYDPTKECPNIQKFLQEILNPEDIPVIQELFGYLLYKEYSIHKSFMFKGSGRNGKSTLINLMKHFIGLQNCSSLSLQQLEYGSFSISDLFGKLGNFYADLSSKSLETTSRFKMATGGDILRGEKKFKDSFNFVNYAKFVFSCNQLPQNYDDTDAFWERWIMITFNKQFIKTADQQLLSKLITPEELSGLLNYALNGLKQVLQQGFSYTQSTDKLREEYIRESDSIGAFVMDCMQIFPDEHEPKKTVFMYYAEYCRQHRYIPKAENIFHQKLQFQVKVEDFRPTIGGVRVQCWKGIKLIDTMKNLDKVDQQIVRDDSPDISNNKVNDVNLNTHLLYEKKSINIYSRVIKKEKMLTSPTGMTESDSLIIGESPCAPQETQKNNVSDGTLESNHNSHKTTTLNTTDLIEQLKQNKDQFEAELLENIFPTEIIQKCLREGLIYKPTTQLYKLLK